MSASNIDDDDGACGWAVGPVGVGVGVGVGVDELLHPSAVTVTANPNKRPNLMLPSPWLLSAFLDVGHPGGGRTVGWPT
jgi:hypothetical protein